MVDLSVVVLNWNGLKHLHDCFTSIEAQDYPGSMEVIVVDNGSTDGSIEFIKKNYPNYTLISNSENRGFCGAANQGIEAASGKYLALLNNDIKFEPGTFSTIMKTWDTAPDNVIGIFPKVLYHSLPDTINCAGSYWTPSGLWRPIALDQKDDPSQSEIIRVFGALFVAPFFKRQELVDIGMFDYDLLFSGSEDFDVSYRANIYGYQFLLNPNAIIYHKMTQALVDNNVHAIDYKVRFAARNVMYVVLKNYELPNLLLYFPWSFFKIIILRAYLRRIKIHGVKVIPHLTAVTAGVVWDIIRNIPTISSRRKEIQSRRTLRDRDVWGNLDTKEPTPSSSVAVST